jgi:hypothetical protein
MACQEGCPDAAAAPYAVVMELQAQPSPSATTQNTAGHRKKTRWLATDGSLSDARAVCDDAEGAVGSGQHQLLPNTRLFSACKTIHNLATPAAPLACAAVTTRHAIKRAATVQQID